jgi:glycosyltransferase involved in cell wall biosynthesis
MEALHIRPANMKNYVGKVGVVQRVLPGYRAAFFDLLAEQCQGGLSVFAGEPRLDEAIAAYQPMSTARHVQARNTHLFSGPLYLCWQAGIGKWLEKWNPIVLIMEANPRYLSTPAAVRWMKRRGRPVIGWGLGAPEVSSSLARLRKARRKAFLRQFDALIAYSQRGADEYRKLGFDTERIFVASNAVARRPKGAPPVRPAFIEKATLLFVGRLQARKRLDSLLRAAASLPPEQQPRLQIVGEGPARADLQQLAAQIYPSAEFLGARYGTDLDTLFAGADVFVLPGTGGLAIQQALASGLPLIVAEGDGSQDDMVRPTNGWRLPPGDEAALRAALAEALSDKARLRNMGAESFRLAQEQFNLESMVAGFVTALNAVSK